MSRARDIAAMPGRNADTKTGLLAFFAQATAPDGWLECNGAAVSRTTYADLFAEIGTDNGAGDGSTTFNLPDIRGEFIRGLDNGRGIDAGRVRGSAQAQDIQSHSHGYAGYTEGFYPTGGREALAPGTSAKGDGSLATSSTGGTETRPRNVAFLACIKT